MTNLNRVATVGHSGAALLNAGMGGASCTRAISRTLRASVLEEALLALEAQIADGTQPWEWAGYAGRTNRREYEAAIAALRKEAEAEQRDASAEMTFGVVTRRMHKREILALCEEYAAKRRTSEALCGFLLAAWGWSRLEPRRLP